MTEIPLPRAFANATDNHTASRWPTGGNQARLDPIYTPILRPRFRLKRGAKIFTIGSCFARHIETHLQQFGFDVPMLSLRVPPEEFSPAPAILDKFTPLSALQEIERTLAMIKNPRQIDRISDEVLFPIMDKKVIDLELREFVPVTKQRARQRRREIFNVFKNVFDADCVVITLGLVECWLDKKTGRAIQEAPHALAMRRAKDRFVLKILDVQETLKAAEHAVRLLLKHGRPDMNILLTVSPVPLRVTFSGMDVVVANAYSKAVLRTVAQTLYDKFERVDYFPSYEMVTVSRSADVWEGDLIHVNDRFVANIVEVLVRDYLDTPAPTSLGHSELMRLDHHFDPRPPLGWVAYVASLTSRCDGNDAPQRSPLVLLENGVELGPTHELHDRIAQLGGGGYSFWKGTLYFSTSDGSDPNTNGRTYTVATRAQEHGTASGKSM